MSWNIYTCQRPGFFATIAACIADNLLVAFCSSKESRAGMLSARPWPDPRCQSLDLPVFGPELRLDLTAPVGDSRH